MLRKKVLSLLIFIIISIYLLIIGIKRDWEALLRAIILLCIAWISLSIVTTVSALLEWKEHRGSDSKPSMPNIWKDKWHQLDDANAMSPFLIIILFLLSILGYICADWIWSSWFSKHQ